MLLGPHDIARHLQHRHRPGWLVWYGLHTGRYWALASWVQDAGGMFDAATPDTLDAAMAAFERLYPKPRPRDAWSLRQLP